MARQAFLFEKEQSSKRASIARVVVHLPVDGIFDYRVPSSLAGKVIPGVRVLVRFGGRKITATCTALADRSAVQDPKEILEVVDREPLLSRALLELTRWIALHYQCGWWEAIASALPAAARRGGRFRKVPFVRLSVRPEEASRLAEELLEKRPGQSRCLRILSEAGGSLDMNTLCRRANVSRSPVDTLVKHRLAGIEWVEQEQRPITGLVEPDKGPITLTDEQSLALDTVVKSLEEGEREDFLLFGVTGSGKTEIYLRVISEVVARGKQAIVLVPEISLTPQTVARFKRRFERVAVLHSGLTEAERYSQWRAIRRGEADVVVGARSGLFAPLPRLGVIVLDEEHETSFKQQNTPRYHARAAALKRGELEGACVILGSATPSLEACRAVREGRMSLLTLTKRVGGGRFPDVTVVHMGLQGPRGKGFLSERLRLALSETLGRRHQAILFLNRRGYHTAILCADCGSPVRCQQCDIALTYHHASNRVICHYCGHEELPPDRCPGCSAMNLRYIGSGTERIEGEVSRAFPSASVLRMDSDTMGARDSHGKALEKFRKGEVDVLIGTQMIAKGLDFPNVTLVGVISADTALLLPDFRSAERTYQLIAQVAGRAGRSEKGGRVIVQTYNPEHYAVELAVGSRYEEFASRELESRRELGYPPYGSLLRTVFSAEAESDASRMARAAADALGRAGLPAGTIVLGPVRAPLPRISGRFRWHLMVKARTRDAIRTAGKALRALPRGKGPESARMQIDVDPLSML